ncbi:MAG: PHP domain-containing protein [Calditrichaeota bacterium]|nr:MAG: PHP domain-containing protein [Calditrichota bacterium]
MKADLHIHSTYSHDAISKPETILQTAAERNIDIVAVTDHETTAAWQEFSQRAKAYPVQVVLGQEIKIWNGKHFAGEVLALFLTSPIHGHTLDDILASVALQDGILSIAHPFCERRGEFRAFDIIEDWSHVAIETRNGRIYKKRDNEMAEGLANRLGLPMTAGSDAHTPFEIGNVFIEFDGKTPQDLKKAIFNRDIQIGGASSHAFFSFLSAFGRFGITL